MPTVPQDAAATEAEQLRRKYPRAFRSAPPMLAGTVIAEHVRCGKPGCRCAQGRLHGPYFYLTRRVNGRLRRTYVPKSELPAVQAMCRNRMMQQEMARKNRAENAALMRSFKSDLQFLSGHLSAMRG